MPHVITGVSDVTFIAADDLPPGTIHPSEIQDLHALLRDRSVYQLCEAHVQMNVGKILAEFAAKLELVALVDIGAGGFPNDALVVDSFPFLVRVDRMLRMLKCAER